MTINQKAVALAILEGRMERTYCLLEEESDLKQATVLSECLKRMWRIYAVINAIQVVDKF